MDYAKHIILKDKGVLDRLISYETQLTKMALSEKIRECQINNEESNEESFSKLIILYLSSEEEIKHEIRRIVSWSHKGDKTQFFIDQFESKEMNIVLTSIRFIGILKDPLAIPYLNQIFSLENIELTKGIVFTLGEIGDPLGIKTVRNALKSSDKGVLVLTIRTLAKWTKEISWKVFKPLLFHDYNEVRSEAAFSIALRKREKSARSVLKALGRETDIKTKYLLLQYAGMIPSRKLLKPMLKIVTKDEDQKARFVASRSLDRVQGLISPREMFRLRNISDSQMRAEVIFRLGKFGTDKERYKNYIRKLLKKTDDQLISQACLQALGFIAEHQDIELLMEYLGKDPMSSYNALMALTKTWRSEDKEDVHQMLREGLFSAYSAVIALTRTWRLEDKDKILDSLHDEMSATQKQVIIKYLIRRRGLSIAPDKILKAVQAILKKDDNINVRYLSLSLLEFAPSVETLEYLLDILTSTTESFEVEATEHSLSKISAHYKDEILKFINSCSIDKCSRLLNFIPSGDDLDFYRELATIVFKKTEGKKEDKSIREIYEATCNIYMLHAEVTRTFIKILPSIGWQKFFIRRLLQKSDTDLIEAVEAEILDLLRVDNEELRADIMQLIIAMRNPRVMPMLTRIAEKNAGTTPGIIAKNIIKYYVEEHII